jgi:uncharacterized protein (TIGR03790 family)
MCGFWFRNRFWLAVFCCLIFPKAFAGGSGMNTVVVINQTSSNSCALANYFCERREVPSDNVLRISWPGSNVSWTNADFQTNLLNPLLTMLAARRLTNQIDYVVLSMDIPFQTLNGSSVNSTTSALFYGLKSDSGPDWAGITNSYAASEGIFRNANPASAPGYSFLATMITANSLADAMRLVDQGVNSDRTFPSAPVVLAKSSDTLRNVRYHAFDNAVFNTRLRGNYSVMETNSDSTSGMTNLLGYQTGLANFSVTPGTFVPGAIADSLTSFGGIIFGPNNQTTLLMFISGGAAGSYGTVTEPTPDPEKFPDPQIYFYQARGFTLAECYYQSLAIPYEGLIVGEPLAAPFSRTGSGQWIGVSSNAVLTGNAPLSVRFSAADHDHPLQQIDLFVDGRFFKTVTNLPPLPGNQLKLTVNGFPISYTVPPGATLASIAADLTDKINTATPLNSNVIASASGDRIELHATATTSTNRPSAPKNLNSSAIGAPSTSAASALQAPYFASSVSGTAASLDTFLSSALSVALESSARGTKACTLNGTPQVGSWLGLTISKTNGSVINVSVTNQSAGATALDLANQFATRINSTPGLQTIDGVVAEDVMAGWLGAVQFNLRARAPGRDAAAIKINFSGSTNLMFTPSGNNTLNDNLSDLQPRNHIYVTAGAASLAAAFSLDTTALPDGYHQLTAVAYEGSHVRTQTRISLPVRAQNTSLNGTLELLDLVSPAPVQGTYHLQVTANTNNVSAITLFSTGGALNTISNQATATFVVNGSDLGPGLHPFRALIETADGAKYQTETFWVRLTD